MDLKGIPVVQDIHLPWSNKQWMNLAASGHSWIRSRKDPTTTYTRTCGTIRTIYLLRTSTCCGGVYIRPYYLYTAPVIKTQNQTLQKRFHSSWQNSFKPCNSNRQPLKECSGSHI
jgi:hypothetical protein